MLLTCASEIVHPSDGAARLLRYTAGKPSRNLISVVAPELQLGLRTALFRAQQSNRGIGIACVRMNRDRRAFYVSMTARTVHDPESDTDFLLVLFHEPEDALHRTLRPGPTSTGIL